MTKNFHIKIIFQFHQNNIPGFNSVTLPLQSNATTVVLKKHVTKQVLEQLTFKRNGTKGNQI